MTLRAFAPGRVNLIGEHTDYTHGFAVPMVIQLGTRITGIAGGDAITLHSLSDPVEVDLSLHAHPPSTGWARYVHAVASLVQPQQGFCGVVESTVPLGSGLSSSASLEVALALVLGTNLAGGALAELCQQAETIATGVPCGIMDQLASVSGRAGHAMVMDCRTNTVEHVPLPAEASWWVVHSGQHRQLESSPYGDRRASCELAERCIGPLRDAHLNDLTAIPDPIVRARARHVISENQRVHHFVDAMSRGDLVAGGEAMTASHRSLRDDFGVSTPTLDGLCDELLGRGDIYGARLTGAGFGGCVVALGNAETDLSDLDRDLWSVTPSDGASIRSGE